MVLFSNVETDVGLRVSSLPSIRRVYLFLVKHEGPGSGSSDWERLPDDSSDKGILVPQHDKTNIRAGHSYAVEMQPVPSPHERSGNNNSNNRYGQQ